MSTTIEVQKGAELLWRIRAQDRTAKEDWCWKQIFVQKTSEIEDPERVTLNGFVAWPDSQIQEVHGWDLGAQFIFEKEKLALIYVE